MIQNRISIDTTVAQRLRTLQDLDFVQFRKLYGYEVMPEICPEKNQIHFFDDGFEAIIEARYNKYTCLIVDEEKKRIIEYSFKGKNFEPIRQE